MDHIPGPGEGSSSPAPDGDEADLVSEGQRTEGASPMEEGKDGDLVSIGVSGKSPLEDGVDGDLISVGRERPLLMGLESLWMSVAVLSEHGEKGRNNAGPPQTVP